VADVSFTLDLTQLTFLNLRNTFVVNINPLSGLKHLTILDLSGNGALVDISPLARMTQLTSLNLRHALLVVA
jgi:Leucine-rich repeat (LRR) protein